MRAKYYILLMIFFTVFGSTAVKGQVNIDSTTQVNVACNGDSTGSISVYITDIGGSGLFEYDISGPVSSTTVSASLNHTFSNLPDGFYIIVVTENGGSGLFDAVFVNVSEPTALSNSSSVTAPSCFGSTDGSIDNTPSGGSSPYTFSWSPGTGMGEDTSGIGDGQYIFTITDSLGCQLNDTITVTEPAEMVIQNDVTHITCFGADDGIIDITGVVGGTGPYDYSFNGGAYGATTTFNGLSPGNYTISVRDATGCIKDSTNIAILEPTALTLTGVVTDATCNGAADGAIDATPGGGAAPYTYSWAPGGTTGEDTSGVPANTYTLTVTDTNGCMIAQGFTVNEPSAINIAGVVTDVTCFGGSDGAIDVTTSGGTAPYTWAWSPGTGAAEDTMALDTGTYTVNVLDSNNCPASQNFTVNQPADISVTANVTDITCFGADDGIIDITGTAGGTPGYNYAIDSPGGPYGPATTFNGLTPGNHTVTIEDLNGCTKDSIFTINEPGEIFPNVTVTHITCFGADDGIIDVTSVTGGTPGFNYAIDSPGGPYGAPSTFNGLTPGAHILSVEDANGCTKDTSITINEPTDLSMTLNLTHITCFGADDGIVDITGASGGTPGYNYAVDNPAGPFSGTTNYPGLTPGNHTVTVEDANGCAKDSIITINEPTEMVINNTVTHITCFGADDGIIDITSITGGTAGYNYAIDNPGGPYGPTTTFNGLTPGNHTVTVEDANGCTKDSVIAINEPLDISVTANITDITCFGADDGIIDITSTSGGTAGYNYAIDSPGGPFGPATTFNGLTPGNHTVTIEDANSCTKDTSFTVNEPAAMIIQHTITDITCYGADDGVIDITGIIGGTPGYNYAIDSPGGPYGPATTFNGLTPGNHIISVEDAAGCALDSTVTINEPDSMTFDVTVTHIDCFGSDNGEIDVVATNGGTPGFNYAMDSPGGPYSGTTNYPGLTPGAHILSVEDANGCTKDTSITINEPTDLSTSAVLTPATCNGGADGAIDLTVSGGTLPIISYSWNPGGQTTEDISGLTQGDYIVTVTDNNGCTEIDTFTVVENLPIIIADSVVNVSCFGGSDGSIDITITGGNPPYGPYAWSHGPTTEDVSGLPADTFIVVVNDSLGCTNSDTFIVTEPTGMAIVGAITDVTCRDSTDGAIDITVSGGVTPYQSYAWQPGGQSTEDISGLAAGQYIVTVTDSNGCTQNDTFDVAEPNYVTITGIITQPTCDGDTDGAIDITPAGGTAPYGPFDWNSGMFTTEDITGIDSGQYIVEVLDVNGCYGTDTFNLTDPDPVSSTAVIGLASCNGGADGSIDLTPAGGTPPYVSFSWDNGATTEDISGLTAGQYIVTVTDSLGCTGVDTFNVSENTPIVIADSITDIQCNGNSTGAVDVTVSGGVPPYASFDWNSGFAATEDISGVPAGQYIFTVTDNVNCVTVDTFVVSEPPAITIVDSITHVLCGGDSTGAIDLTVSGGVGGFSYLWTPGGSTSEDTSNVIAGSYDFSVTDSNGCVFMNTYVVNENTPMSSTSATTTTCANDSSGTIDLTVSGGVTPYSFDWNSGTYSTEDLDSLPGGVYTVVITDSVGCTHHDTITINTDAVPTGVFTSTTDTACFNETVTFNALMDNPPFFDHPGGSYSFDNGTTFGNINTFIHNSTTAGDTIVTMIYRDAVGCISDPDTLRLHVLPEITATFDTLVFPTCTGPPGELRVHNIAGGLAPYFVSFNSGAAVQTNDTTYTGLAPGIHTVDINDAHGCMLSQSINFLSSITATIDTTEPSCYGLCDGELALSNVTGGVAPYEFSLDDTIADPFDPADSVFSALCAGNYDIYIKDSTDCIAILNVTLGQPDSIVINELGIKDESCNGVGDGEITVSASGGNGDYTFTFGGNMTTGAGPHTFTNIPAGQDTIFLTDSVGCTDDHIFTIDSSDALVPYISELTASSGCNINDGVGIVDSVDGGSGSYQFSINGGVSFQDTNVFTTLLAGSYLVITRDKILGCEDTTRFEISAPAGVNMPSIVSTITDPSCVTNDGTISLTSITGGSTPYTFSLSGPTTAPSQSDSTFNDLVEGFYFITITDNSGCDHPYYFFVGPATPLNMTATPTPEQCINSDGTVTLNISGGQMPYLVNINDGASYNLDTTFSTPTLFINNLSAGVYDITLSDSSNPSCTDVLTITITSNRSDAILQTDTVTCPWSTDGTLEITLSDNALYSFAFSIDDTLSFDTSRSYSSLAPGVHELWIKQYDLMTGDSCIYPDNETYYYVPWSDTLLGVLYDSSSYAHMWDDTTLYDTFTVANFITFAPDSMNTGFTTTNADKNEFNGTALVHNITGGTPGYFYSIGDTTSYIAYNSADTTQNLIINLPPGDTLIYVRDSNMCVQEFVFNVGVNLFIPNIFTPNDDGDNDTFEICGLTEDAELRVYNRWGSLVYYHEKYDNSWSGTKLSDGTYFFEIKTVSGESYNGWVEILR